MGKLIDFNTGEEVIAPLLTVEDEFMIDLMFIMSSSITEEDVRESIFLKYNITIKT